MWSLGKFSSMSAIVGIFRKKWPKSLFLFGTIDFTFKNLVLDFLGLKEKIIRLAQYLSKNLVWPYKLFPDVFHVRENDNR